MACTDLNVTTSMDETIMVKGCLGLLPCGRRSKASGKKSSSAAGDKATKGRSAPVPAVSSPTKVAKPSAAVLPSPRHSLPHNPKKTEEITKNSTANVNSKPSLHDAVKGQLQLGFHVDGQTILVQIFEAKNLKLRSPFCPGDACYVAVELVSKTEENKRQTTKSVSDMSPIFNEEFVLRMKTGSNESARLVISVYKTNSTTGCDEMIGCMSFGISGLQEKCTSNMDVYYLLSRPLGDEEAPENEPGQALEPSRQHVRCKQSVLPDEQANQLTVSENNQQKQQQQQHERCIQATTDAVQKVQKRFPIHRANRFDNRGNRLRLLGCYLRIDVVVPNGGFQPQQLLPTPPQQHHQALNAAS